MARQDDSNQIGENYVMDAEKLRELGISLTMGPQGQILVMKYRVKHGMSTQLYKWTGPQPRLPKNPTRH